MEYVQMNQLDFSFLGEKYSELKMVRIAEGEIHPVTFMEYDVDVENNLTYVPNVPLRTNSTLMNAKRMESKGPRAFKKKQDGHRQESQAMQRFLNGAPQQSQRYVAKKFDPSDF